MISLLRLHNKSQVTSKQQKSLDVDRGVNGEDEDGAPVADLPKILLPR